MSWRIVAELLIDDSQRIIRPVVNGLRTQHRRPSGRTPIHSTIIATIVSLLALFSTTAVRAQPSIQITGDRLSGFVLPIEPLEGDIHLRASRGWTWQKDDTKRLYLEDNVVITIRNQTFHADSVVIWLNRMPSSIGVINQIAMYFDEVTEPTARAGLGVSGSNLLVTSSAQGNVSLEISLLNRGSPRRNPIVERGEERLADYLNGLFVNEQRLTRRPQVDAPDQPLDTEPMPGGPIRPAEIAPPESVMLPPLSGKSLPLFDPNATVTFNWREVSITEGEDENTIALTGPLVISYIPSRPDNEWVELTLTAERAVVFTDPFPVRPTGGLQLTAKSVRGIYLEGNVNVSANNGQYNVRAPKAYYDLRTGQAILLSAVLRTYATNDQIPVYVRAEELRQLSQDQWSGEHVNVSASEFHTPHLSIGAESVIVTQKPGRTSEEAEHTHIRATHNTMRVSGVPVLYWPQFSGTVRDTAIRSVSFGTRDNDGLRVETTYDAFTLLGLDHLDGVDATLKLDGFTKRGVGVGTEVDYYGDFGRGAIDLYGLYDDGVDRTSSGRDVNHDENFRGVALYEHKWQLTNTLSMQIQASKISDESFITTWREGDFRERREYETSLYLKHQRRNAAFTVLTQYDLNDFISNSYLLASRQYQVDRLPEIGYRRYGDSFFDDYLVYSTENRFSRLRLRFDRSRPSELGARRAAFGLLADDQLSDVLRARGLQSDYITRWDTRHELAMPFSWGPVKITPFLVGRGTGYSDEFDEFSSDSDDMRLYASGGVRLSSTMHRIDNNVESQLFDLHRLRHIVEPRMTLWYAHSDVSEDDLPVYDDDIESLATGAAIEMGVRNTWQTQRGGPGRWHSADVLTIDTSVVLNSDDANTESPSPQWFDYRPEYSQFGDHARAAFIWQLSDSFSIAGEGIVETDDVNMTRGSIGADMRHSENVTTFLEYRVLDASDNKLLDAGLSYRISPKYRVAFSPQYDTRADEFRSMRVRVLRSFPDFDLEVQVRYDRIRDDTSFAASLSRADF